MNCFAGVSALGSVFRPTIDEEGMAVVQAAVKAGINWFDAAPWYGHGKGETVFGRVEFYTFYFLETFMDKLGRKFNVLEFL